MHKLAELCVRRPVFATMLVLSLVVVGVYSFSGLGVDLLPNIDVPTVAVSVANPGRLAGADRDRDHQEDRGRGQHHQRHRRAALDVDRGPRRRSSSRSCSRKTATSRRRKCATRSTWSSATCPRPPWRRSSRSSIPTRCRSCRLRSAGTGRCATSPRSPTSDQAAARDHQRRRPGADRRRRRAGDSGPRRSGQDARLSGLTVGEVAAALRQQNLELPGGRVEQGSQELTVRTIGRLSDPRGLQSPSPSRPAARTSSDRRHRRRRSTPRRSCAAPRSSTAHRRSRCRLEAVRPEHGDGRPRRQEPGWPNWQPTLPPDVKTHRRRRSVGVHRGRRPIARAAPGAWQHPGVGRHLLLPRQHPDHDHRGDRHPRCRSSRRSR